MASLLKPKTEKPAILRFSCSQNLAARLKKLEDVASSQGIEIDLDAALAGALEKLVSQAEREILPPAAPVQQQRQDAASTGTSGDAPGVAAAASSNV